MTNISNLFNFIESKRPEYKIPFTVKLIYDPESITEDELIVKGDLYLIKEPITSLPDGLTVEGTLELKGTKIISLPDNLTVGGSLSLYGTKVKSIPNGLTVGGSLTLFHTPLSKQLSRKYSSWVAENEILKMIQDKGGNVKGNIYI